MPSIHAVLFDYGLVLSGPPHPEAWESMKRTLRASEEAFSEAYWRFRHQYDRGTLHGSTYWRSVAEALGRDLRPEQLRDLQAEDVKLWTQPNVPMIEWAGRLQRAGVKTGILSNIGDAMEDGIREKMDWLQGFAHHTFSHRLNLAKPELAIYRHAAEGLGVPAENILFIDDRTENVLAAVEAGMQAVQYANHEEFVAEMRARGLEYLLEV